MNRPWKIWSVFGACALVVLAALAWLSFTTLRLERAQLEASQQAELEERVRLALWRMDSALAPLIVEESARPWSAYQAFSGTELAYTKAGKGYNRAQQGDVLVASPLLSFTSSNVLLHFQYSPGQRATSPQVPEGEQRQLAESGYTTPAHIAAASGHLEKMRRILQEKAPAEHKSPTQTSSSTEANLQLQNGLVLLRESGMTNANNIVQVNAGQNPQQLLLANYDSRQQFETIQNYRNTAEFAQRANVYQQTQQRVSEDNFKINALNMPANQPMPAPPVMNPGQGTFKPLWLGDALVLARRVNQSGTSAVQGVWLNWTNLRPSLLSSISDLFPAAELQPVRGQGSENDTRRLAALPVKLVPGPVPSSVLIVWTPIRLTLAFAWACVMVAALAVALLLHGTISLSERRGAFVSAVTHELRTPLTTFKMYSEMLAEGMVPDESRRKHYLSTLCSEANRLSHLVENVLAYARLERGSARSRVERVSLGELIARIKPRLQERAEQVGMTIREDTDPMAAAATVHVDVSAVEQILFNLVDNACKYAAPTAAEKVIHLEALPENGKFAMLRIRDHGQGISAEGLKRLFQPFSKSAHEAAHTAPGVGLGLALCRRLSRSMGGDLQLADGGRSGACFVLSLPLSAPGVATIA